MANLQLITFRLKFRKEINTATIEMLDVMKEEISREFDKRRKKKTKWKN